MLNILLSAYTLVSSIPLVMLFAWWDIHAMMVLHYGLWVILLLLHDLCG